MRFSYKNHLVVHQSSYMYYSRSDIFYQDYHSLLNLQIQMVITSLILGIRSSPFDMLQV